MLLDGFHGVFLALCIESSPFCIPLWQQLALSLSEANGFLTESPQVVYLFVEVKRKQRGQDKDLFSPPLHHFMANSRKQCPQYISVILPVSQIVTQLLFIQFAAVSCCSALTCT